MKMTSHIPDITSSCNFLRFLSLVTGLSFMSILSQILEFRQFSFTENPEIWNTPIWVLDNIWGLVRVRDTKFGKNVSNKMLLNDLKWQGYRFYRFWVIEWKPAGAGGAIKLTPTQIRVNKAHFLIVFCKRQNTQDHRSFCLILKT